MAFKEKRREKRYYVDMSCEVGERSVKMKVIDVSMYGLGILGDEILVIDRPVDVTIDYEDNPITIRAVVRNMVKLGNNYRYGLEIVSDRDGWMRTVYEYIIKNE